MSSSRRLAKAPETIPEESESDSGPSHGAGNTAQNRASRISNACDQCQRRKTKCTGRPSPCEACGKADLKCHFDPKPTARNRGKSVYSAEDERLQYLLNAVMTSIKHSDDRSLGGLVESLRNSLPPQEVAARLRHNLATLQDQGLIPKKDLDQMELLSLSTKIQSDYRSQPSTSDAEMLSPMDIDPSSSISTFTGAGQLPLPGVFQPSSYSPYQTQQQGMFSTAQMPALLDHHVPQEAYLDTTTQPVYTDPISPESQITPISPQWPHSYPFQTYPDHHSPSLSQNISPTFSSPTFQHPSQGSWYATQRHSPYLNQDQPHQQPPYHFHPYTTVPTYRNIVSPTQIATNHLSYQSQLSPALRNPTASTNATSSTSALPGPSSTQGPPRQPRPPTAAEKATAASAAAAAAAAGTPPAPQRRKQGQAPAPAPRPRPRQFASSSSPRSAPNAQSPPNAPPAATLSRTTPKPQSPTETSVPGTSATAAAKPAPTPRSKPKPQSADEKAATRSGSGSGSGSATPNQS